MKTVACMLTLIWINLFPIHSQTPIELGDVKWLRDIHQASALSKQTGKPILILFQEIPGCITCQRYGSEVLRHPLIVESIEQEFIPLAIHNNKGGEDARVLKLFGEPSWNNPVVRIVDASLKDILPRLDANYSPAGITDLMERALAMRKKVVPDYLKLTSDEVSATETKQLFFSMSCFWEGEKNLGKLDGVVSTEPGFMQGQEVVKVNYNPLVIQSSQLILEARKQDCARSVFADEKYRSEEQALNKEIKKAQAFKPDHEPQYYLRHSAYRFVPMLAIQASRLNSILAKGGNPETVLSPRQIEFYKFFQINPGKGDPEAYHDGDLNKIWKKCADLMKKV